ncbi:MAG: hypothetical protein K2K83_05250, partial [Rikenella sp.]|nr:hypothetical protein [Rikenella sp.]
RFGKLRPFVPLLTSDMWLRSGSRVLAAETAIRSVASGSKVPVPGEAPAPKTGTPAPGYRHHGSGTLYNVGRGGYSWSSTIPLEEW